VFEDLHWADEATLDLVRVVGRRLRNLPLLVVGTFRDEEVESGHGLRLAIGDLPAGTVAEITVPPLSPAGVGTLASGTEIDPEALHRATAGNPFFVTRRYSPGESTACLSRCAMPSSRASPGSRRRRRR